MNEWWRTQLSRRPWWMNVLMIFCAYLAFVYVPWDFFFKPVAADREVWFGIALRGWAAKLTEPLHWAIYLAGAYGFWRMRRWMWPWAAVYAAQVAFATLVWNIAYVGGLRGWVGGLASGAAIGAVALALWRAQQAFEAPRATLRERYGEWALVTGASAGIGAEFARVLARDGMSCVLVARREDRLRALAAELEQTAHVATRVVAIDLEKPDAGDEVARAVADLEIGFLVNNAGFGYAGRFEKQATDRLRAMVQLNCVTPVVLTSRLLPSMRARGKGKIVNIGSGSIFVGGNGLVHYVASKSGVIGLTRGLARELGEHNIFVNTLLPGLTDSDSNRANTTRDYLESEAKQRSIKRIQVPEDLVGALMFLVSDDSDFVSGQNLNCDGGRLFI